MEDDRVIVEALEPRQLLSGTGPLAHRHLIPRFHEGDTIRLWRHPSHTVDPVAMVGHYAGFGNGVLPASLTIV